MSTQKNYNTFQIQNPILPGFHPDPSICRKGDDFYIACSSFAYYPGIPLYHSRDLAHWEPIGYALDRPEHLELTPDSGGLFAPTLRYHDGLFYLIVSNTTIGWTLLLTAEDPAGPWSDVAKIGGTGGDPSLFWDDDGSCWCSYNFDGIYNQKLNLETMQLEGDPVLLWNGVAADAWFPEASHIYKKDGWYYLLIAEGGTEHYHAVTVARSRAVNGPYESYMGNPILTHRHLSYYNPIANVGHADFVDTPNGEWYMVALASRIYGGYHKNMGRETFICPMIWESDWPVVSPMTGKVEFTYPAPDLPEYPVTGYNPADNFDAPVLSGQWNYLGTPVNQPARLSGSCLYIRALPAPIWKAPEPWVPDVDGPAGEPETVQDFQASVRRMQKTVASEALGFVGRRQQHISYTVTADMEFNPMEGEAAGLVLLQNNRNQLRVERTCVNGQQLVRVVRGAALPDREPGRNEIADLPRYPYQGEDILGQLPWTGKHAVLQLKAEGQSNSFYIGCDAQHLVPVAMNVDGSFLGSETCSGFVGAYIGMFATANGAESDNEAAFDWFVYCPKD